MNENAPDPDDVVAYVDRLLRGMARKGQTSLALDSTEPLPRLNVRGMESLDHASVAARLRLMAGMKSPAGEGRMVLRLSAGEFEVHARFADSEAGRSCELSMSRQN